MSKLFLATYSFLRTLSSENINKIATSPSRKDKNRRSFVFEEDNICVTNFNLKNLNIIQDMDVLLDWRMEILFNLDKLQEQIKKMVSNFKVLEKNPPMDETKEDFTKLLSYSLKYYEFYVQKTFWLNNKFFLYLRQDLYKKNFKLILRSYHMIKSQIDDYKKKFKMIIEIYVKIEEMYETNNYRCRAYKKMLKELKSFSEKVTPMSHTYESLMKIFDTFDKLKIDN